MLQVFLNIMQCLVVLQHTYRFTTSGGMYLAPTPDANYKFRVYYNKMPNRTGLSGTGFNNNTYLSNISHKAYYMHV